ncbi:MAG: phenylalanine--tRNA ligase beta subunit-related protein [bacterium]
MKIPLIWLKDYLELSKSPQEIANDFTQLGLMLDKPIENQVLDLEQRLNRSDLLSLIGCARDLSAFENIPLKLPKFSTKSGKLPTPSSQIPIAVKTPHVRRFQTRVIKGIKVGPSPKWLTDRITAYGMESINNIVDITNFVMIEYGQTMHAQDIAKLPGNDITIRPAKSGEQITTLLGTEVKLDSDIFVLTSGGVVTVIGGIIGGKMTGVTEGTNDIILDAGNYDSRIIRKISRRIKIINESVNRNDKFLDPRTIDIAMSRATDLILRLAGGTAYENDDYYPNPVTPKTMTLRLSRLALLSGMDIPRVIIKKIFKSLEYVIVEESTEAITLEVPYFRTDLEVEDDLIGDILRINNYSNIPSSSLTTPVPQDITQSIYRFGDHLRDLLVAQGAHEHITSSLVTSNGESNEIVLANALSSDQNALRTTLIPGLTHVLSTYRKHKKPNLTVFEIGKVFNKQNRKYLEHRQLTVCSDGDVRDSLVTLLHALGISGTIGQLQANSYTLDTQELMALAKDYTGITSKYSHTQSRDLSLLVPFNLTYADITKTIAKLTLTIKSITCKSFTKFKDSNNYLLTITWPEKSDLDTEQALILTTLKKALKIESKS